MQSYSFQATANAGHSHCTTVDGNGNGITTTDAGHAHSVRGHVIAPAPDGHTHQTLQMVCQQHGGSMAGGPGCLPCNKQNKRP